MPRIPHPAPLRTPFLSLPAGVPWALSLALLLAPAGCGGDGGDPPRAILVSIDALNEEILRRTLTEAEAPVLHALFDEGACAEHAVSHFPSVTAASHATLWTGAWGDVHGITSNTMPRLPRDAHSILESWNGFHYQALAAEPLWITAGRVGVSVAGHHVTQAPGVPGYPAVTGERTEWQEARRRESARVLASPHVHVMNGYNSRPVQQRMIRGQDVRWVPGAGWVGPEEWASLLPPRVFELEMGPLGVLHGAVVALGGEETGGAPVYDALLLAREPSGAGAVMARLAPPESEPLASGRSLARHFSDPLPVPAEGGRAWIPVRLFELAPDGSDFLLYQPPIHLVEGNRDEMTAAYEEAIGGWTGNSGFLVYRNGGFGPTLAQGGDGTAEARYLETAEHLLRQFRDGSEWLWRTHGPRLLMDYFPLSDAIDHEVLAYLDPEWPGYNEEAARKIRDFRARVWGLVDLRLGHLQALVREAGGALFVSGDHGMRSSWNAFHVNLALRDAGLLALDGDGNIDLSRTRAASPNGYFIRINRTESPGGIVPPAEEAQVLAAVVEALEGARDPRGDPVVTRVFLPEEHGEMGIGGVAGGDVYWGTAPGIRTTSSVRAEGVLQPGFLTSGHGFPPDEPDMHTVFCAWGEGFSPGRIPPVQSTVVAPTVAEYVGVPRPADAVGSSVLRALREGGGR